MACCLIKNSSVCFCLNAFNNKWQERRGVQDISAFSYLPDQISGCIAIGSGMDWDVIQRVLHHKPFKHNGLLIGLKQAQHTHCPTYGISKVLICNSVFQKWYLLGAHITAIVWYGGWKRRWNKWRRKRKRDSNHGSSPPTHTPQALLQRASEKKNMYLLIVKDEKQTLLSSQSWLSNLLL